jgi:hypothetical protein
MHGSEFPIRARATLSALATLLCVSASATLLCAGASAIGASGATATTTGASGTTPAPGSHSLYKSHELWATIDVCNPPDQPDTVGVRGSMPSDGQAHERMYMSFRLQYEDTATGKWVDLSTGSAAAPTFVPVGAATSARQAGRSFQLVPVAGKPAVTLRGVVSFQWRRGATVVHAVSRPTTAGQLSLAGADPAGFSAATCVIG